MDCQYCHTSNSDNAKYCYRCGSLLNKIRYCPNCGTSYEYDVKYCTNCGFHTEPYSIFEAAGNNPPKDWLTALLLCIFLGVLGIHRFYCGKIGTGILWLLTGGVFGIGYLVDIIMIASGDFRDKYGRPLLKK